LSITAVAPTKNALIYLTMQRTLRLALAPACGAALVAKPLGHFLALSQEACSPDAYTGPANYDGLCAALDSDCKDRCAALAAKHKAHVAELKAECEKQTRILDGKEEDHADEKADRKEEDMDVATANKAVAEKAHCRPELSAAKEDLGKEEAIPNDDSAAIDAECKAKKRVMEAEQCVEVLVRAEAVLSKENADHKEESHEEGQAASALPPQEERKRIACAAVNIPEPACDCGDLDAKKDALLKKADQYVADLLAEYLRQKKILEGKVDDHSDEKADVKQQEGVVGEEWSDVKNAKETVKDHAHCPPDLEKAKDELAKAQAELDNQRAIPDDTPTDIDAECEAKKAVLEAEAAVRLAEQCVEKLRRAEAVLRSQEAEHSDEHSDLKGEERQEDSAAAALPPQEKIVCDLKAALDAARAARDSLPCGKKSEPKPEPEEKKSGAARAATATAVFAVLVGALLQA